MFVFKKLFFLSLLFLISGCTLNNFDKIQNINNLSIEVDTPNDNYNVHFKENLKRFFHIRDNTKYLLKTNIAFNSTETLSVTGVL